MTDDDLERLAADLFDKLSSMRWPPPMPEQIRGMIYSHFEHVRASATCGSCDRLRAERNRLVETTELGALSERLEEDNAASDASIVRSAMHEVARLRAALKQIEEYEAGRGDDVNSLYSMMVAHTALHPASL